MKKILSLLSLLMVTVMAFAQSYQDALQFKVNLMGNKSVDLPNGTLSIEKRVDGTYNVVAQGCDFSSYEMGNWNDIVCEEVEGTTDENGLTTINVENPYVYATSGDYANNFTGTSLEVKFNGTKAYAHFVGSVKIMFVARSFEYTFGTDEGWSTGGGETGGGETPSTNVKVVVDGYTPNKSDFEFPFTVDWETQRLVAKIDLTNCEDTYSYSNYAYNPDNIFSIAKSGVDVSKWSVDGLYIHTYYSSRESKLKVNSPTKGASKEIVLAKGVVTFILDKEGLKYLNGEDEVVLLEASTLTGLYDQTDLIFGSKEGYGRSNATYELVEVQPLATEPVTPPVVEPIDPTVVVDLVDLGYVADGNGFKQTHRIDWTTQKVVASVDLSSCQNVKDASEAVFVAGSEDLDWSYDLFTWFVKTGYLNHNLRGGNGKQTQGVDKTQTVKFELSKDGGYRVNGNVVYEASNSNLTPLFGGENITVGSCANNQASNATYNYIKIVPLDWTEPVTPPAVEETEGTVVEGSQNYAANGQKFEWSNVAIDWNTQKLVAVVDLSTCGDDTKNENILSVGEDISAWTGANSYHFYYTKSDKGDGALRMKVNYLNSKNVINDGKTGIEAGTVRIEISKKNGVTVDGVEFNTLHSDITSGTWQELTADFWALTSVNVGSKQGDNRSNAIIKYVSVVDLPAEPEVTEVSNKDYMNTLKLADATTHEQYVSKEAATVNLIVYSDNTAKLTFKDVALGGEGTVNLAFKGVYTENEGTFTLTEATGDEVVKEMFDESTVLTANGTVSEDALSFTYTITTADGVFEGSFAPKEEVTLVSDKNYTSNMRIFDTEDESEANLFQSDNAQVNIMKYSDNSYIVTLKNVTLGGQTANLVFEGNEDAGVVTSDEETEETEQVVSVIAQASEETEQILGEGTMAWFQWIEKSEDEIQMQFTLMNQNEETGYTYAGEFNYENETPEPPVTEPFSKENFVGDGTNFNWSIPIDWDTQKVVMELDFSTCETGCEHIFGLGVDGTGWNKNLHMYRTSSDQKLQCYWDGGDGNGNNNTDKFDESTPTYVEVSKEKGFVVNDETKIAAGRMDALYEMTTLTMGTGEGQNVLSHATYKYVKVVDKDWTREPETGINAVEAQFGADAQFYTVDGVKLSKLQKGLNIVRSADGKVKKVLVK